MSFNRLVKEGKSEAASAYISVPANFQYMLVRDLTSSTKEQLSNMYAQRRQIQEDFTLDSDTKKQLLRNLYKEQMTLLESTTQVAQQMLAGRNE